MDSMLEGNEQDSRCCVMFMLVPATSYLTSLPDLTCSFNNTHADFLRKFVQNVFVLNFRSVFVW